METQTNALRPQQHTNPGGHVALPTHHLSAERRLVQRVFEHCNEVITEACARSSVPAEFLGALAANESGGRADATRFEPAVYRHLVAVAQGKSPSYGSINVTRLDDEVADLLPANDAALHARYMTRGFADIHSPELQRSTDDALRQLATSWGYTQIMGYHMVGRKGSVHQLVDPRYHFRMAIWLLSEFAVDYQLDVASDFEEMFRCWNTGRPHGHTFDPDYVENGLRRMQIYRQLRQIQPAAR